VTRVAAIDPISPVVTLDRAGKVSEVGPGKMPFTIDLAPEPSTS
jgi:hypothetical protein